MAKDKALQLPAAEIASKESHMASSGTIELVARFLLKQCSGHEISVQ